MNSISENETWINISKLGGFFLDLYLYKQEVKWIQFAANKHEMESNWKARMSDVSELLDKHNRTNPGIWFSSSKILNATVQQSIADSLLALRGLRDRRSQF